MGLLMEEDGQRPDRHRRQAVDPGRAHAFAAMFDRAEDRLPRAVAIKPDGVGEVGGADRRVALAVAAMAIETLPPVAEQYAAARRRRAVGGAAFEHEQIVDEIADLGGSQRRDLVAR